MIVNSPLYDICPKCGETLAHFNGYSVYVELIDEPAPEITVTGATVRDSVEKEKQ